MKPKVVVFIAMSMDGYIAKPDGDLSFLSIVEKKGEDYGYSSFIKNIETVILGRKTYDMICKLAGYFPHADKETYVFTRTPKDNCGNTHFYSGSARELVTKLQKKNTKNIFVDGGAQIIHLFLQEKLIDELTISIIPVLLGSGIRLFEKEFPEKKLHLLNSENFPSGLVQLHYHIDQ